MARVFPGNAAAAAVPIRWESWTRPSAALAFPGDATPAQTPLRWSLWAPGAAPPAKSMARPPAVRPDAGPATPAPAQRLRSVPRVSPAHADTAVALHPHLGVQPLTAALAASHAGVADAHAAYLEQQRLNLERLAELHQRLVGIALD